MSKVKLENLKRRLANAKERGNERAIERITNRIKDLTGSEPVIEKEVMEDQTDEQVVTEEKEVIEPILTDENEIPTDDEDQEVSNQEEDTE